MLAIIAGGLLLGLGFHLGIFFWVYWYLRMRLLSMACDTHRGRPIKLFILGLLGFMVSVVMVYGLLAGLTYVCVMDARRGGSSNSLIGLTILLGAMGLAGAIGWLVVGVQRLACRAEMKRFEAAFPLPKLQLWMQDLLAAAFFFALYMGFLQGFGSKLNRSTEEVVALSAWVMLCMGCGLFFALDVCRRSLRLQAALPRFLFLFGVMLFTTITFLVPAWLTWRAFRFALWRAGWVLGKDLERKQRAEKMARGPAPKPEVMPQA